MADKLKSVSGLDDLVDTLKGVPDKLRRRALLNALKAGARVVQKVVRANTPRLAKPSKYRTPGTVQNAVSVRTSKIAKSNGDVGAFVNVRPAKGAVRGAKSPLDPFYWRWLNFGWNPAGQDRSKAGKAARRKLSKAAAPKRVPGAEFLQKGAAVLGDALTAFEQSIGPQIQKLDKSPKDPL